LTGTTPIPIPTSAGTNYSWRKVVGLEITTPDAGTSISNKRIRLGSAPATGVVLAFNAVATYTQATSGNKPTDNNTTNEAIPAGYTQLTTTNQVYDADSDSAASAGLVGDYIDLIAGLSANYA